MLDLDVSSGIDQIRGVLIALPTVLPIPPPEGVPV